MHSLSETGKVYIDKPTFKMFHTYIHPDDFKKRVYKTPKREAKDQFEIVSFELVEIDDKSIQDKIEDLGTGPV